METVSIQDRYENIRKILTNITLALNDLDFIRNQDTIFTNHPFIKRYYFQQVYFVVIEMNKLIQKEEKQSLNKLINNLKSPPKQNQPSNDILYQSKIIDQVEKELLNKQDTISDLKTLRDKAYAHKDHNFYFIGDLNLDDIIDLNNLLIKNYNSLCAIYNVDTFINSNMNFESLERFLSFNNIINTNI